MDMKKRIASVILALLVSIAAFPAGALAAQADPEYVDIFFGDFSTYGIELADWSSQSYGGSFTCRDNGTISWDDDNKILTLTDITINVGTGSSGITFSDKTPTDYTLVLNGTNTITAGNSGIRMLTQEGSLTITGDGSLDITAGTYGIGCLEDSARPYNYDGDFIFDGGSTSIHISARNGDGVATGAGKILIKDGSLSVDMLPESIDGISADGILSRESIVHVSGGTVRVNTTGSGISGAAVLISGGDITAENADDDDGTMFSGIAADGTFDSSKVPAESDILDEGGGFWSLMVTGGTINAKGRYGLYSDDRISIYGGNVTATRAGSRSPTHAIYTQRSANCTWHPGCAADTHICYPDGSTVTPSGATVFGQTELGLVGTWVQNADGTSPETVTIDAGNAPALYRLKLEGVKTGQSMPPNTSGYYMPGMTVPIYAGLAGSGDPFTYWSAEPALDFTQLTYSNGTEVVGGASFVMPDHDVTVTAHWGETPPESDTYTVTVGNPGTLPSGSTSGEGSYKPGDSVTIRAGSKDNLQFAGWTTGSSDVTFADASASETTFSMPAHNVTVTATWETVPTYRLRVEFTGDYAEGESSGAGLYPAGTEVTINAGTQEGSVFRSWATTENSEITFKDKWNGPKSPIAVIIMPARDDEVHAYWTDVSTTYDVYVDTDGGVLADGESSGAGKYIQYGEGTLNAGTRTGYTFAGWSYLTNEVSIPNPESPTSSFTLLATHSVKITATWKQNTDIPPSSDTYHVSVDTNGGVQAAGESSGEGDYQEDAIVYVRAGTREGYAFDKWTITGLSAADSTANPLIFQMPSNNVTAAASWKETYPLTVQCPEGTVGASVSKRCAAGDAVVLKAGTLAGHTFEGWSTDSGDVTINRPNDAEWANFDMPNHAVTVTANWTRNDASSYALTISGEGDGASGAGSYEAGQTVSVSAGTREGYTFAGWAAEGVSLGSGSGSDVTFAMPAGDVSLKACWTPVPVDGVMTLHLDELPGDLIINGSGYTCGSEGNVRHTFSGAYVLTQKTPGTATGNTVTVRPSGTTRQFDITLQDVYIAGTDRAAFSAEDLAEIQLTLAGNSTLTGGANHAGLEMVSGTGYDQTTVTIKGEGSLSAAGGTGGAGIGGGPGNDFGVIEITGGTVIAQGGAGAAGIGGGSCFANGGDGTGCANATGNAVSITGGNVTATAGSTSGNLRGAAGIGTGEGLSNQSGGPYVFIHIGGGNAAAQGAGDAPAIGGTYIGNIRITGGTVTTKANPQCVTEIGVSPNTSGTQSVICQVRLSDDRTGAGSAVVFVTRAGVIDEQPSTPYAGNNYTWNGIVYAGDEGQLYVSVNAESHIVEWENLTVPAGKTLNIPQGVLVKLPAEGTVNGKLSGGGRVQVGDVLHYIKEDGTIAPCEAEYTDTDGGITTPRVFSTLQSLLSSPFLGASGNRIRLLTDVDYPGDIEFPNCFDVELDLNGHTLNLGGNQLNTGVRDLFTVSDTSADKSGKITGNSGEAVVLSPEGNLAVSGGTFENAGSGPAVQYTYTRDVSRLTGGVFSRISIAAHQGSEPAPLTGILGSGLAFYDEAAGVWISPSSRKADLSGVAVRAKVLPALTTDHVKGSNEVSVSGLSTSASAYQWLYSEDQNGAAAALEGAVGPVLYLDDGTLGKDGCVSCLVTVDGTVILTDAIYVLAVKPAVLITVAPGTYLYNGKPHTPAVTVKDSENTLLTEGEDYRLSYENNVTAGQAFAVITALKADASFTSARKSFVIAKAPLTIQAADQTVQPAQAVQSGVSMAQADGLAEGDRLTSVTITAEGQQTVPSAAKIQNAAGKDVTGCYEITYRPGVLTVTGGGSGQTPGGSGSSGGGSGSSGSGSGSSGGGSGSLSGSRNPDGSVTTTRTDRNTGTVTETTRYPDGSVVVVETQKNGAKTITTTETDSSGIQRQTVERPDGSSTVTVWTEDGTTAKTEISSQQQMDSTVTLSRQTVAAAGDEAIILPLPAVHVSSDSDQAPTVTILTSGAQTVTAAVPVSNITASTVAVLVHPDGSEEILKKSLPDQDNIVFQVENGATVKIVDNAKTFDDIPETYWASSSVDFVTSRELFLGTSETTFSPDRTMTRGMLMMVLARLDGQDTSGGSVWYDPGVTWAVANGISDGSAPETDISREQLIVMLYRSAGSPTPPDLLLDFIDADQVGDYALDAMRWAISQGILQGKAGNLLAPKDPATRAQVARILENYLRSL